MPNTSLYNYRTHFTCYCRFQFTETCLWNTICNNPWVDKNCATRIIPRLNPGSVCQWHCLMEYLTLLEAIVVFTGGQCGSKIIAKLHSLFKNLSAPQSEWQNLILERKIYYPWVALLMQIKSSCSVLKNQCNRDQNYHRYLFIHVSITFPEKLNSKFECVLFPVSMLTSCFKKNRCSVTCPNTSSWPW